MGGKTIDVMGEINVRDFHEIEPGLMNISQFGGLPSLSNALLSVSFACSSFGLNRKINPRS